MHNLYPLKKKKKGCSWYSLCPFKGKNFRLLIITGFAVVWEQRLSLSYLGNMSQNQTTDKFMEVYIVMNICFSKDHLLRVGVTLKFGQDEKNRQTWDGNIIGYFSYLWNQKDRLLSSHQNCVPSSKMWERIGGLFLYFIFFNNSLLLNKLTKALSLPQNYKLKT